MPRKKPKQPLTLPIPLISGHVSGLYYLAQVMHGLMMS